MNFHRNLPIPIRVIFWGFLSCGNLVENSKFSKIGKKKKERVDFEKYLVFDTHEKLESLRRFEVFENAKEYSAHILWKIF